MGYSGLAKQRAVTLQGKDDREFGTYTAPWRFHASTEFTPKIRERIGRSAPRFIGVAAKKAKEAMILIFGCIQSLVIRPGAMRESG